MGIFLNPGNDRFRQALNSQIYVDKSELISVTNKRVSSEQKYICVSRPRRFGKSVNLGMLAAYYSKGCDSRELFDGLAVSKDEGYPDHLNKYNVIYLNMQQFLSESHDIGNMLELLSKSIMYDLEDDYAPLSPEKRLERFCYAGDDRNIIARYLDGKKLVIH